MAKQLTKKQKMQNAVCIYAMIMACLIFGMIGFGIIFYVISLFEPMLEGKTITLAIGFWSVFFMVSLVSIILIFGGILFWLMDWLLDNLPFIDDPNQVGLSGGFGD